MNSKHKKTLQAILAYPSSGAIEWNEIESLLIAVGAVLKEGRENSVRFIFGNEKLTIHRPHPEKYAKPYQVKDARNFLKAIGVAP